MDEQLEDVPDLFAPQSQPSLQDAFEQFRQKRIQLNALARKQLQPKHRTPEQLQILRQKFIDTAFKYLGVPYRKCEHPDGSELSTYYIELDCCGLVRQVLYDMEDDLGFKPLFFNQAYQFDTLPLRYDSHDKIKPGDLVFYAGRYEDTFKRPQKHNMVHVEIYLGGNETPEKCIGSRFRKGVVSVFDSYKFHSTAWGLEKMYFCSIDTWLDGVCFSDCPLHQWEQGRIKSLKGSIFDPIGIEDEIANEGN
ncbi:hypothetical protein SS50377_28177 [Spironucleus salmonicida]|uniref:NlpC/P60 family protein n=1 Tax=Spironucleus salmonicida TaxID=348837 RepID=V6LZU8_9EUKA|nr:hypothetical protein SS50377_28177 [Spironucleus salmonicida]|eukprot:EST46379.1 hypothetical protein SS50377_13622 [Spironucleus salmonicida]